MKSYNRNKQKGFTLIELLVVIAIIALITSALLATFNSARIDARDSAKVQNVQAMVNAINLYSASYGQCPVIGTGPESSNQYNTAYSAAGPELDGDWPYSDGDQLKAALGSYMSKLPETINPSFSNLYSYSYAYNDASLELWWPGSGGGTYCLAQPQGNCYVSVPLEKHKNLPNGSLFSAPSSSTFYLVPVGSYSITQTSCP